MANKTKITLPTRNGTEETCPECRINHVEPPFDYCGMCEMLTSYFREKVATAGQIHDQQLFSEAYEKWRSILTWSQIEKMRDEYWTARKRAQIRAAR